MARKKFNNKIVKIGDFTFDSQAEADYYLHLSDLQDKGIVRNIVLQPVFLLQEGFTKNGIRHQKISYKADFLIHYTDGRIEVVDVKGAVTPLFSMKRKMFEYKYREHNLLLLKYVKKYGGWITLEEHKKIVKANKKKRETKKKETQ